MQIGDGALKAAAQALYNGLAPLLRLRQRTFFPLQPLASAVCALRLLPAAQLAASRRTRLLVRLTYELVRLSIDYDALPLANHYARPTSPPSPPSSPPPPPIRGGTDTIGRRGDRRR